MIKQYEEETNLRLHLLVDSSASMKYGQGEQNKYEYASSIAACLAYLANRQQDATGLVTFDNKIRRNLSPRTSRYQLARILEALDGTGPNNTTDLYAIMREVAESVPRRGVLVLISDLLGVGDSLVKALSLLRKRGHDVIVFHTLHDEEIDFPFTGATRFEGLEDSRFLNCNPRALREGYLEALNAFLEGTRRVCARLSVDYEMVRTNQPLDAVLAKFLSARASMPTLKG
ncbi:MAG: VWA domain-containing protein [Pirellulaceae bacterium]